MPLKTILKILPWLLLATIIFTLYISSHWPFGGSNSEKTHFIDQTSILHEIETLGKLELVKYNFKEVVDYSIISDGKIKTNLYTNTYDYNPDISALVVASGEAVGCIDLTKLSEQDIKIENDTLIITLPDPELCYYKLNLDKTKIHNVTKPSWWAKLLSDEDEEQKVIENAYRSAEKQIKESALESGILEQTKDNARIILTPFLEKITGIPVTIRFNESLQGQIDLK